MKPLENNSFFEKKDKLSATLISGVNGVGKTTTIGKIGKILKANGTIKLCLQLQILLELQQ